MTHPHGAHDPDHVGGHIHPDTGTHTHTHSGQDEEGLADQLDLDARVHGPWVDDILGWVLEQAPTSPGGITDMGDIVDLGAGTGTGSLALARRFGAAHIVAVDRSALMLERLAAAARAAGVDDRVRGLQADLDAGWPEVGEPAGAGAGARAGTVAGAGTVDLAWAASSVHELADPGRLFRDVHDALVPGGLFVVVELDGLPRVLPDDLGRGRPGLEARCLALADRAGWNAHPDWTADLTAAGLEVVGKRSFTTEADPAPDGAGQYAGTHLRRIRGAFGNQLDDEDRAVLDDLLDPDHPESLLRRGDLRLRGSRTAWLARRPDPGTGGG